jgi:ABC-2 type transport system ATP-binding protein
MNPLELRGLRYAYGRNDVLQGVDLDVRPGSFHALLGSNGAGKSTLLQLCAGMRQPGGGTIRVLGADAAVPHALDWNRIGYVAESQRLYDWYTCGELIAFTRTLHPTWDEAFCGRLLGILGIPLERKVSRCSKGEVMKLRLLLAMAYRPRLLLLDEPFSGLDAAAQEQLVAALVDAAAESEWSVFFTSHDLESVERLADTVSLLHRGVLAVDEPLDVLQARFRRVTLFDPAAPLPEETLLQVRRDETGLRFVDAAFSPEREEALRRRHGDAVDISLLSLRQIVVALTESSPSLTV